MKLVVPLLLVLFLLESSSLLVPITIVHAENTTEFSPQDMVLQDDAFHGRQNLPFTEWWYFDATFDNGYSIQIGVLIDSVRGKGFVFKHLDLYYNHTVIAKKKVIYPVSDLTASSELPLVQIQGKTLLSGTQNMTTGFFEYNTSFEFPGYAAQLHFVGCTKGWKGNEKSGDWWVVALPRADVTGTLTVNNETMNVTGTGYHDHNCDVTPKSFLRFGWFWGKFTTPNFSATWGVLLPNRFSIKPLLVINTKNAGYLGIPSKDVWFTKSDIHLNHLRRVPFFFNIGTMTDTVFLAVDMKVVNVDYTHIFGSMRYWRFHVQCTGVILIQGHAETVDGVFIAEYIRFR